jgi:2-hydroxychromene-2-carboxylate isomerase
MKKITYYAMPISPWTYLGHQRFCDMAAKAGASVELKMMDLGQVFAISGGLPLPQRSAQRQAYRLQELARWRDELKLALTIQPKFFPTNALNATLITLHLRDTVSTAAALGFLGAVLKAVWADELNIADDAVLSALLTQQSLSADLLHAAQNDATKTAYAKDTQDAMSAQVFGAPTYLLDDQLYWGQDRLNFVEKHLAS